MAFGEQELMKLSDRRKSPCRGRRLEALMIQPGEIEAQTFGRHADRMIAAVDEAAEVVCEVSTIGVERVPGGPPFGRDHIEEQVEQPRR